MRLAPPNLSRRYTEVMAVKVLPAPVAMCTRARGLFSASDFSRPVTALIWQSRRFRSGSAGICFPARRRRRVSGCARQAASVSGLKKWKISRERGAGSALSVKRMIWPVASNRKRSGVLSLRHLRLALA
jgi:hypothetical protein